MCKFVHFYSMNCCQSLGSVRNNTKGSLKIIIKMLLIFTQLHVAKGHLTSITQLLLLNFNNYYSSLCYYATCSFVINYYYYYTNNYYNYTMRSIRKKLLLLAIPIQYTTLHSLFSHYL